MGVSTLASYRNSHLFEGFGLAEELLSGIFEDACDFRAEEFGRFDRGL